MAQRIVRWSLDGVVLKLLRAIEEVEIGAEFDLSKLFPGFADMTDVQKQVIVYGVKQKLSDTGSGQIADYKGKVTQAKETWEDLLNGKFKGDRVNATGAAEERAIAKNLKAESTVVSLTGLFAKKLLGKGWTEEDEAKLQEFMEVAVKASKESKRAKN